MRGQNISFHPTCDLAIFLLFFLNQSIHFRWNKNKGMTDVDALNAEISALKSELSISTKEAQSTRRKLLRAQEENEATVKEFAARQEFCRFSRTH